MPISRTYDAVLPAPFGAIGLRTDCDAICGLDFLSLPAAPKSPQGALAREAARQIAQYLAQPDFRFDLPLAPAGTAFQRTVWAQISVIAPGSTNTYGQIAGVLHSAPRAVGQACGANPCPLITPCHRVLTATGGLGGYSGRVGDAAFLLRVKRWLLAHEGVEVRP